MLTSAPLWVNCNTGAANKFTKKTKESCYKEVLIQHIKHRLCIETKPTNMGLQKKQQNKQIRLTKKMKQLTKQQSKFNNKIGKNIYQKKAINTNISEVKTTQ